MPLDQIAAALLCLLFLAVLVFDLLPIDQAGLMVLILVVLTGLVPPEDALGGFGNPAVITIGSLLVVAEGLHRTGSLAWIHKGLIQRSRGRPRRLMALFCLGIAVASAFVNNTPIVAVFLPLAMGLAAEIRLPPSKLLIPLSYAAILGGTCTLIGTHTNVVVSAILVQHGEPAIGMFEILPVGLALAAFGLAYLVFLGPWLLPARPSLTVAPEGVPVREFVTEVAIRSGSALVGRPLGELLGRLQAKLLLLVRDEEMLWPPLEDTTLEAADILLVKGPVNSIAEVHRQPDLEILPELLGGKVSFDPRSMAFVELLVTPGSLVLGRRVRELELSSRLGLVPVAVMRRGRHIREKVSCLSLQSGDVLLAFGDDEAVAEVRRSEEFAVLEGVHEEVRNRGRALWALLLLAGLVGTVMAGLLPVAVAAMAGALGMVLAGCLSQTQAFRAVNWRILFLLVGAMALGRGLELSGLAGRLAGGLGDLVGKEPLLGLAALYVVGSLLTELLSNGAVAVLMTPVCFSLAGGLGLEPRPFVMALLFACSASFATPVGYQTNTLVYGAGGYRYRDFLVIGIPLQVICLILTLVLVPLVWPFRPA